MQVPRRFRPSPAMVVAVFALFVALGGTAAALKGSNTVFSNDIVRDGVKNSDLANSSVDTSELTADAITGAKVADGSLGGSDLAPDTLGGSDILESSLEAVPIATDAGTLDGIDSRGFVNGRGTMISERLLLAADGVPRTLLQIPGLGELRTQCSETVGSVNWRNTTASDIDFWVLDGLAGIAPANGTFGYGLADSSRTTAIDNPAGKLSLGLGNDPGARRIANVDVNVYQSADGAPCGVQAQVMLWTSQ